MRLAATEPKCNNLDINWSKMSRKTEESNLSMWRSIGWLHVAYVGVAATDSQQATFS